MLALGSYAQDFVKIDNTVKTYPTTYNSLDRLASRIQSDFRSDEDRARAIFTWIALNIKYDTSPGALGRAPIKYSYSTEAERQAKIAEIEMNLARETLQKKTGVCHGYAMLYKILAEKMGIETEVIHGTAKILPKDIGKGPVTSNHAWNAVNINGQWKLIDVTWGSGGIMGTTRKFGFLFDDNYFFTQPDVFFRNHFPDDKKWLLTNKNEQDFAEQPLYYDLGYDLIAPNFGVLKIQKGAGQVPFKIKGIQPTDEVAYQFTSGMYSKKVTPNIVNGVAEFNVQVDAATKGTLTIFVNKMSVAAYTVQR